MAVSFNKEVITEAIQEVLAETVSQMYVTPTNKKDIKDALKKKGVTDTSAVDKAKPGEVIAVEEDHHENPNDDSDMAKSQLYAIAKYALELLQMIKDGDPLDAWVQAKITKASDYIDAVQHYLEGEEYLDANQGESEEELAESDYQARTKEDLVFQYLRDAWQFGAMKGKDVNPDEELSTMADSLLANLPDYDSAEKVEKPKEKSAFEKRLEKLAAAEKERRANLKEDTLDEIKKAEFEKIKPGKELQLRGYGVVKVIENDGIVMKIKDSLDKVHTINLGQYNEKFLKEARKRGEKTVRTELDATIAKMKELAKKYKEGDKSVVPTLKDLTVKKKALSAELEKIVAGIGAGQEYKGEVDESLTENKATCCGKCGRTHVKGTECKKPFLTGKDHCRVR